MGIKKKIQYTFKILKIVITNDERKDALLELGDKCLARDKYNKKTSTNLMKELEDILDRS